MNSSEPCPVPWRITHDGQRKLAPVVTTAGQEIVYSVHESPTLVALKRLKLVDGSQERLHPELAAHQFDACFSPDGLYHCFALSANSPQLVLVIQNTRDRTEATFRPRDSRATARSPSIAPDCSRVVFSLSDRGGQQIAAVDLQGRDLKKLAESAGLNSWPSFAPDGKWIAFGSSRAGHFQIYRMRPDGNGVERLTHGPAVDMRPVWSPDGSRIAFTSNRDGKYEIYIMNADGAGQRRLTRHADRNDYPAWHPDGKSLFFISERGGRCELYRTDVPTSL